MIGSATTGNAPAERDQGASGSPGGGAAARSSGPLEGESPELLALAAHDLRSSLAVSYGFVELLRHQWDEVDETSRRYYLDRAADHLADLTELLEDLLDVSRRQPGEPDPDAVIFDLGKLVLEVVSLFADTHPDRLVETTVSLRRPAVCASPKSIQRVVRNLLVNAMSYSPPGASVNVQVFEVNGELRVSIGDQGPGMDPEDEERLFRRYSRAASTGKGSGLGLYVCRRLVELEGGRIWVDSQPGQGSTVTFAIPKA